MENGNVTLQDRRQEWRYPKSILLTVLILLSLVAFFVCLGDDFAPSSYKNLFWLPLAHAFILMVCYLRLLKGSFYEDLPALILLIIFTVRNALGPMIMALETYSSKMGIPELEREVNSAVRMMIYETAAVVLTMFVCIRTCEKKKRPPRIKVIYGFDRNLLFRAILLGGVLISIVSFMALPELRTQYYTIFTNDMTHILQEEMEYEGGVKRALATASGMIIEATRLTLSTAMICWIRKWGQTRLTFFLSLLVILVQFLFMNDSNAYIIMLAFALFILLYRIFPKYRKAAVRCLLAVTVAFGVLMYFNRFSQDMYGESLAGFLQAYFPGIPNFVGIFNVPRQDLFGTLEQILIDLYAAVPFRSTLFGYDGSLVALPTLWHNVNESHGQILPNVAQSYYYFGEFLSPLLSVIMTVWAFSAFKKAKTTRNPYLFSVYVYMTIYICASIIMYDFYILSKAVLQRMLFMYLFSYYATEKFERFDMPAQ